MDQMDAYKSYQRQTLLLCNQGRGSNLARQTSTSDSLSVMNKPGSCFVSRVRKSFSKP